MSNSFTRNRMYRTARMVNALFLSFLFINLFSLSYCTAIYNVTSSRSVSQGITLTSPGQIFELGFFTPNNSNNQYVGIWYKKIVPRSVIWVANREKPVTDSLANLTIGSDGNLWLVDGQQNTLWSTNVSVPSNRSSATLSDAGNFVLNDDVTGEILWQSFEHPGDTIVPSTLKVFDPKTGNNFHLTAWKSENDPSPGNFTVGTVPTQSPPQAFIWNGAAPHWRSGPWDKSKFIGIPPLDGLYSFTVVRDSGEQGTISINFYAFNNSVMVKILISSEGSLKVKNWESGKDWRDYFTAPMSPCDVYGSCGPFGFCKNATTLKCQCLKGFVPKSKAEWSQGNWKGGCVRRTELDCERNASATARQNGKPDGFFRVESVKLPDSYNIQRAVDSNACRQWCQNNCSCSAYAFILENGCLVWTVDLMDIQKLDPGGGGDFFLRLAHTELGGQKLPTKLIISLIVIASVAFFGVLIYSLRKWRAKRRVKSKDATETSGDSLQLYAQKSHSQDKDELDLPMFDFDSIVVATDNFDMTNKLGQGGYGPVYKGKLRDGKQVAIKRLSSSSGQGVEEFKNEITLISKLQHRNLVKLIGYCVEGEEKILIYEFMSNKSLDTYLFDTKKKAELDWSKRFNIIQGVARGLVYLHRDSCLRVIHRDLKVSNILLDEKMNSKISDFGLARIFEGTHDLANTRRIVGTLGYMSPEYVLGGVFSEKSDVFSFGILILEIICGKKTTNLQIHGHHLGLVAYAWKSWCESTGLDMIDEALGDSFSAAEVSRCVNIGLLCVQDNAADRPTMVEVLSMLRGETKLPEPNQPTFTFQMTSSNSYAESSTDRIVMSRNEMSHSVIEGR